MKLTITREDLRQFVLKEANIDISQVPIDIDIEGYKQMTGRYKWQETTEKLHDTLGFQGENDPVPDKIYGIAARPSQDLPKRTTTVDGNGFVTDIKEEKPKRAAIRDILKSHHDYTDYENTVLDFATSSEHKRQVPFFGDITISCAKERYGKIIKKLGVSDSVKFSRIDSLPYLVKIEGQESMNDILNKGVNA